MWTLESTYICIIQTLIVVVPNQAAYKWPEKSGHLDNPHTFGWSQGVHNTQVPLYAIMETVSLDLYIYIDYYISKRYSDLTVDF